MGFCLDLGECEGKRGKNVGTSLRKLSPLQRVVSEILAEPGL